MSSVINRITAGLGINSKNTYKQLGNSAAENFPYPTEDQIELKHFNAALDQVLLIFCNFNF